MAIRILTDEHQMACLYCSVTDWAFGPVFYSDDEHDAEERALSFLRYLPQDARQYNDMELEEKYHDWLNQEKEQWKKEEEIERMKYESNGKID